MTPSARVRAFLGPSITTTVENADTIQSFTVGRLMIPDPDSTREWFSPFHPILAWGPTLRPSQARVVVGAIASSSSYDFSDHKLCSFAPVMGYRFVHGDRKVDVALCFSCFEWSFSDGRERRGEDFDGAAVEMFDLAHELFPKLYLGARSEAERALRRRRGW